MSGADAPCSKRPCRLHVLELSCEWREAYCESGKAAGSPRRSATQRLPTARVPHATNGSHPPRGITLEWCEWKPRSRRRNLVGCGFSSLAAPASLVLTLCASSRGWVTPSRFSTVAARKPYLPAGHILGDCRDMAALRPKADVVIDLILSSGAQAASLMQVFRGVAHRVVAASSIDVYRACGVLHGSEEGPLEPVPLTEDSPLRTKLQTYPPAQVKMLQKVFGWIDDEYDKIPVERLFQSGRGAT
jgi:hypothetical protein